MKLGYARVSTEDQSLELQRPRLRSAGCERLFEEKISGAKRNRPELEKLVGEIRVGDVLVVTRLDRLARSTAELLAIAERLMEKEAGLQSLDEPWADTVSPSGRMILTVFERALIRQRTRDGLVDARKRGVAFGRPPKMRPDQQKLVHELLNQGRSISEIARTFNVHPATIYRCREASEGL
jgi:DNA invertase Pin-like site-specific DNA recombinase